MINKLSDEASFTNIYVKNILPEFPRRIILKLNGDYWIPILWDIYIFVNYQLL